MAHHRQEFVLQAFCHFLMGNIVEDEHSPTYVAGTICQRRTTNAYDNEISIWALDHDLLAHDDFAPKCSGESKLLALEHLPIQVVEAIEARVVSRLGPTHYV